MDDPLAAEYDFLLAGTGLDQAVLAAALAKSGKKVLHIDHRVHYGAHYASLMLHELDEALAGDQGTEPALPDIDAVSRALLRLERAGIPTEDVGIVRCPVIEERLVACPTELPGETFASKELAEREKRRVSIDLTPRMVLGKGRLVTALINSGVAQYLEFHALDASLMARREGGPGGAPSLLRVPCTKQEVFRSRALGLAEKRVLMKFMQRCFDEAIEDAATQNERALAVGRSLTRPQNKRAGPGGAAPGSASSGAASAPREEAGAEAALDPAMSPLLRDAVLYAIACLDRDPAACGTTAAELRARIQQFVTSLGRFSVTAFLAPVYGTSELAQGFCRMSAVSGSVYVLRRHLAALLVRKATGAFLGGVDCEGDLLRARCLLAEDAAMGAWAGGGVPGATLEEMAASRGEPRAESAQEEQEQEPGAAAGEEEGTSQQAPTEEPAPEPRHEEAAVLLLEHAAAATAPRTRWCSTVVARAVAVVDRPLLPREGEEKGLSMLVLPPGAPPAAHGQPVFVLQQDSRLLCCPPNTYLVQLSCLAHGRSAQEAGRKGCEVLLDVIAALGKQTAESEDSSAGGGKDDEGSPPPPVGAFLWRSFFLRFAEGDGERAADRPSNVHVAVGMPALHVSNEADVAAAEAVFNALLPGENFLPPKEEEAAEDEVEDIEIEAALAQQGAQQHDAGHEGGEPFATSEPVEGQAPGEGK